jgi:hypothetical protein
MKAISLWQPWASLVATRNKWVETRSWQTPYRGPILIHAARRKVTRDEREYFESVAAFQDAMRMGEISWDTMPYGQMVALAVLGRVVPTEAIRDAIPDMEYAFGDYSNGRWAWVFTRIDPIDPFPYKGERGLFDLPYGLTIPR